ncbi:sentrin-specific protease 6 isoform X2 [Brienomyrus brachyistius]|uniref:sentrin-specific protease 6 isoform X2 n=1 Tax=Brienomyrus brachyistius TaxID=42636 RepID=UPI0020B3B4EB|nr:sentrin-specific protease 6 isoform X2 [Brienomyrus brachyistius]
MASRRTAFIEALDKSESKKDGGFKANWSFSLSDASEEQANHSSRVSMDEAEEQREGAAGGRQSPQLKNFTAGEHLKTYERKQTNHSRLLKGNGLGVLKLGAGRKHSENPHAVTPPPNRTNYFVVSHTPPQGVVVQGRLFQHANAPAVIGKNVQSNLDLKERKDYNTQQIQRVELDSIILTCPEIPVSQEADVKRRVQQNRRRPFLEASGSFTSSAKRMEPQPLDPQDYLTVCGKCDKPSEDHVRCQNCGNPLAEDTPAPLPTPAEPRVPPLARNPIRPQAATGPNSLAVSKSFYGAASGMRAPRGDVVISPPVRITRGSLPLDGRPAGAPGSAVTYSAKACRGKRQLPSKQHELNDPIVLSSDDEDQDGENSSTGSVSRLDSVSPRPADSAHSSPAPCGGRVEAAVKVLPEQEELNSSFFMDMDSRITLPRKTRMKDQFGNAVTEDATNLKRRKVVSNMNSIILDCRSVRLGSLRRMVTKPVIFSVDYIQLETEGPEQDVLEKVRLRASELTSCEWCTVRKLPVLFLQTTASECLRLRSQLRMSREHSLWYDCKSTDLAEQYIVLIFEDGLTMREQVILEEILQEIGRSNNLSDFPAKLLFEEANKRLVRYNGSEAKVMEDARQVRTRLSARLQTFFEDDDDEAEDMSELQPTFTGPVVKLMVYPPAPAKGGISVTNEDLHCLSDGEFLNDVIIDFYLKYLFLEKLKTEDAQRSHVFSSFFYKRLNQRERRNVPDAAHLPIQKKKHNRVKTWTRHVDLFQKDFIFVPINESAHWYLAVICFPGLERQILEPNPLYQGMGSVPRASPYKKASLIDAPAEDELLRGPPAREEQSPPHGQHIADASSESDSSSDQTKCSTAPPKGGGREHSTGLNGQSNPQPYYTDGLHRISVCYAGQGRAEDVCTFSDDQSSSQDECSEDGTLADDSLTSCQSTEWTSRADICKQPCILIMDSLRGPTRSTVVKTLREYLEVEWEAKRGTQRSFGKDVMRGSSPRVPQQDNFSDCGVYVLQYVESFFESPIPSFHLPMNLSEWFPQQRMKTKREEIKELILKIQSQQQLDKKGQCAPRDLELGDVSDLRSPPTP